MMLQKYLEKIREKIPSIPKILKEILVVVCAIFVVIVLIFGFLCWRLDIAVFGSYFSIPRATAVKALMTTRKWGEKEIAGYTRAQLVDKGVIGLEDSGLGPLQAWSPAANNATSPGEFLEILHLSDAQIRDTLILDRKNYSLNDLIPIFKSTLRMELIENLDSLLLAAILRGYRNAIASYNPSRLRGVLAVHTGDLLDISLVTEMIDAAAAVKYACRGSVQNVQNLEGKPPDPLPFLSVPGNHDGLTFGNIQDKNSITWELGLNQLEFHLASLELLEDVRSNECVARNEAETALLNGEVESLEGAPEFSKRLKDRGSGVGPDVLHYTPVALKGKVNIANEEAGAIQPGYFSVVRNGFRIIVLDTRWKQGESGNVGPVQLGWLYHELSASLAKRQPVLIFAHHQPRDFQWLSLSTRFGEEGKALKNLIHSFPHVLGYFYGHKHKVEVPKPPEDKKDSVWFVQAPSLVDFPMGALIVRVEREKDSQKYRLTVKHVKALPDRKKGEGLVLDALQDEALIYAAYDDKKLKKLHYPGRTSKDFGPFSKTIQWNEQCPKPQEALANNHLVESITKDRVRLIKEKSGAWYDNGHQPQKVSQSRE